MKKAILRTPDLTRPLPGSGRVPKRKKRYTKGRYLRGDLVTHANRGNAIFEHYEADDSSCCIRLNGGDSIRVSTSLVKPRNNTLA